MLGIKKEISACKKLETIQKLNLITKAYNLESTTRRSHSSS